MAVYHYSEKAVKRSAGQSAVNSAAYVSKDAIKDERIEKKFDYSRQQNELQYSKTLIPEGANFKDAAEMWNSVESAEKSKNAVVGQRVDIALPRELTLEQQIEIADKVATARLKEGRGVTYAIHDHGDGNPHIDMIMTPRPWDAETQKWGKKSQSVVMTDKNGQPILNPKRGAGQTKYKRKNVNIDDREHILSRRKEWQVLANDALKKAGSNERIDCRTLAAQRSDAIANGDIEKAIALDREPTIHEYRMSERAEKNRAIRSRNAQKQKILRRQNALKKRVATLEKEIAKKEGKSYHARYQISYRANTKRQESFRALAEVQHLQSLQSGGLDSQERRDNVLLSRTESRNFEPLARSARTTSDERTRHHSVVRPVRARGARGRGYRGLTAHSFLTLSERAQANVMNELRKPPVCLHLQSREFKAEFVRSALFLQDKNGGIKLSPMSLQDAERAHGIKPGMKLSAHKAARIGGSYDSQSKNKNRKMHPAARKWGQNVSKAFSSSNSGGGLFKADSTKATAKGAVKAMTGALSVAMDKDSTSFDHLKQAKDNIKEVLKTPVNVVKDILSNPLTAIIKAPFRAMAAVANAGTAVANVMAATTKTQKDERENDAPVRSRF